MKGLSPKKTLTIFTNLHRSAHSFEIASKELTSTAKSTMEFASEINTKSNGFNINFADINSDFLTISSAVEEFTINMKSISDNAAQSIKNIDIISTSTSEFSNTASEIAKNTGSAKAYSNDSMEVLKEASINFEKLRNASKEIDIVTQTITSIADQTNLLALNATIEAARAGSAGKGFAVVANEVKELAKQSKNATQEITEKVNVIQSGIMATVSSMEMISEVINKMNNLVDNIAAATEEQSITSRDMSDNIQNFLEQINLVIENVSQSEIAIEEVNIKIASSASRSEEMMDSSKNMSSDSEMMKKNSVAMYAYAMEAAGAGENIYKDIKKVNIPSAIINSINKEKSVLARYTEEYSVKVKDMDDQHIRIFDYINKVHTELKLKSPIESLIPIMEDLLDFTTKHFAEEQILMKKIHYQGLSKQLSEHTALLSQVSDYVDKMKSGEEFDMIAVLVFLRDWLFDHIKVEDQKYSIPMNKNGIK